MYAGAFGTVMLACLVIAGEGEGRARDEGEGFEPKVDKKTKPKTNEPKSLRVIQKGCDLQVINL